MSSENRKSGSRSAPRQGRFPGPPVLSVGRLSLQERHFADFGVAAAGGRDEQSFQLPRAQVDGVVETQRDTSERGFRRGSGSLLNAHNISFRGRIRFTYLLSSFDG